jgi:hypothetical protein
VDLDEKKRPLETPRLPDWARPKLQRRGGEYGVNGKHEANSQPKAQTGGGAKNGRGGLYRDELLGHVKVLCGTVGFSLSKSVLRAVAKVEDPDKIRDIAKLTAGFEKLQDMARGVERLRAAVAKAGDQRYAALCRELNLASESIDDIPDRTVLRRLVETLEGGSTQTPNGTSNGPAGNGSQHDTPGLSELRGRLLREANRVSGATGRPLAVVINQAANGTFTFANLRTLGAGDIGKVQAVLTELQRMATPA